jgi:serine/threonine protein kinase
MNSNKNETGPPEPVPRDNNPDEPGTSISITVPEPPPLPPEYEAALHAWLDESVDAHISRWKRGEKPTRRGVSRNAIPDTGNSTKTLETSIKDDMASSSASPTVLNDRYILLRKLSEEAACQTWIGRDLDSEQQLIRLWHYRDGEPDDTARALWNDELRLLYRVCSSRAAEESILLLRDAGIDRDARVFVMVMEIKGRGYYQLADALRERQQHDWLTLAGLKQPTARAYLWKAFHRLAKGVEALHNQHVIHRNISAESIYFDPNGGAETMRLGGFEWSVRLGFTTGSSNTAGITWSTPPEVAAGRQGYSFDGDWYAFGLLIARCFFPLEHLSGNPPEKLGDAIRELVSRNEMGALSELEHHLILRLIAQNADDRLTYAREITWLLQRVHKNLATGAIHDRSDQPLVLAFSSANDYLIVAAHEAGFRPNPEDPDENFSALNQMHVANLKEFLRLELQDARLYPGRDKPGRQPREAYLVGKQLTFLIGQCIDEQSGQSNWDVAFLRSPSDLRTADPDTQRDLRSIPIVAVPLRELRHHLNHQPWDRYLEFDTMDFRNPEIERFHDFLRCTNQLELLMSCAQIFHYRVVERTKRPHEDVLMIEGEPRSFPKFCQIEGGLPELLNREVESGKPDCELVLLTQKPDLNVAYIQYTIYRLLVR